MKKNIDPTNLSEFSQDITKAKNAVQATATVMGTLGSSTLDTLGILASFSNQLDDIENELSSGSFEQSIVGIGDAISDLGSSTLDTLDILESFSRQLDDIENGLPNPLKQNIGDITNAIGNLGSSTLGTLGILASFSRQLDYMEKTLSTGSLEQSIIGITTAIGDLGITTLGSFAVLTFFSNQLDYIEKTLSTGLLEEGILSITNAIGDLGISTLGSFAILSFFSNQLDYIEKTLSTGLFEESILGITNAMGNLGISTFYTLNALNALSRQLAEIENQLLEGSHIYIAPYTGVLSQELDGDTRSGNTPTIIDTVQPAVETTKEGLDISLAVLEQLLETDPLGNADILRSLKTVGKVTGVVGNIFGAGFLVNDLIKIYQNKEYTAEEKNLKAAPVITKFISDLLAGAIGTAAGLAGGPLVGLGVGWLSSIAFDLIIDKILDAPNQERLDAIAIEKAKAKEEVPIAVNSHPNNTSIGPITKEEYEAQEQAKLGYSNSIAELELLEQLFSGIAFDPKFIGNLVGEMGGGLLASFTDPLRVLFDDIAGSFNEIAITFDKIAGSFNEIQLNNILSLEGTNGLIDTNIIPQSLQDRVTQNGIMPNSMQAQTQKLYTDISINYGSTMVTQTYGNTTTTQSFPTGNVRMAREMT